MSLLRRPRSIRLRLAALLTVLFVLLGATLLGLTYALVRPRLIGHSDASPTAERTAHGAERRVRGGDSSDHGSLADLTREYLAITAGMALLSGLLGWFVAGRVLRPMSEITATARRVSRESLHERIALDGPDDELKQLGDTFDSMLARLEAGFERERAFVRNASHELRTPLSVIRTEADVALADEADDPQGLRRSLLVVREASERSERLIAALLALARADRGDQPAVEIDLAQLVREVAHEADGAGLHLELALREAPLHGDRAQLRVMVANLIDNAIRHNTAGGWVLVRTDSAAGETRLEVSNSGPRITAGEAASLTKPFLRLGAERTGPGFGLGLSIAASVVQAHEGELAIDPLEEGGLRVSIRLPVVAANSPIDSVAQPAPRHA
jgi:signal transduction histidine kinase